MLNYKLKPCCERCKYAAIQAKITPPYLARMIAGKPDGELMPYTITITCDHQHVCKDFIESEEE